MTWDKLLSNMFSYSWDFLGVIMAATIIWSVVKFHRSPEYDRFNLLDLVMDHDSNKLSDSKFRLNIAFLITTFVMIYLTLNGKLTEWYVTSFLGAWVIDRWGARSASVNSVRNERDFIREQLEGGRYDDDVTTPGRNDPPPRGRVPPNQNLNPYPANRQRRTDGDFHEQQQRPNQQQVPGSDQRQQPLPGDVEGEG